MIKCLISGCWCPFDCFLPVKHPGSTVAYPCFICSKLHETLVIHFWLWTASFPTVFLPKGHRVNQTWENIRESSQNWWTDWYRACTNTMLRTNQVFEYLSSGSRTSRCKANLPITVEIHHCHIVAEGRGQARPREDQLHGHMLFCHGVRFKKSDLATVTSSGRSGYDGQLTLPDEGQTGIDGESWRTEYETFKSTSSS